MGPATLQLFDTLFDKVYNLLLDDFRPSTFEIAPPLKHEPLTILEARDSAPASNSVAVIVIGSSNPPCIQLEALTTKTNIYVSTASSTSGHPQSSRTWHDLRVLPRLDEQRTLVLLRPGDLIRVGVRRLEVAPLHLTTFTSSQGTQTISQVVSGEVTSLSRSFEDLPGPAMQSDSEDVPSFVSSPALTGPAKCSKIIEETPPEDFISGSSQNPSHLSLDFQSAAEDIHPAITTKPTDSPAKIATDLAPPNDVDELFNSLPPIPNLPLENDELDYSQQSQVLHDNQPPSPCVEDVAQDNIETGVETDFGADDECYAGNVDATVDNSLNEDAKERELSFEASPEEEELHNDKSVSASPTNASDHGTFEENGQPQESTGPPKKVDVGHTRIVPKLQARVVIKTNIPVVQASKSAANSRRTSMEKSQVTNRPTTRSSQPTTPSRGVTAKRSEASNKPVTRSSTNTLTKPVSSSVEPLSANSSRKRQSESEEQPRPPKRAKRRQIVLDSQSSSEIEVRQPALSARKQRTNLKQWIGKPPRVAFSNCGNLEEMVSVTQFLKQKKATKARSNSNTANILVLGGDMLRTSLKVLSALASATPIVTKAWLTKSMEADQLLATEDFQHSAIIKQDRSHLLQSKLLHVTAKVKQHFTPYNAFFTLAKAIGARSVVSEPCKYADDHLVLVLDEADGAAHVAADHVCYVKDMFTDGIIKGQFDFGSKYQVKQTQAGSSQSRKSRGSSLARLSDAPPSTPNSSEATKRGRGRQCAQVDLADEAQATLPVQKAKRGPCRPRKSA